MGTTFKCKELNCQETVNYEKERIPGLFRGVSSDSKNKRVYLTCLQGHTYAYEIVERDEEAGGEEKNERDT